MSQYSAFIAMLIPVLVSAVTKSGVSDKLRALLTAALAVAAAAVNNKNGVVDPTTFGNAVLMLVSAVGVYAGFWKHFKINEKVLPNVGFGYVEAG
jgi:hypothetical protein